MKTSRFSFWGQEIVLAVGKANEEFKVANIRLAIPELNGGIVYILEESSGSGFRRFAIAFNEDRGIKGSTIAHEVWHLYMNILQLVSGDTEYTAEELHKEAYAWMFGELFREINSRIQRRNDEAIHSDAGLPW